MNSPILAEQYQTSYYPPMPVLHIEISSPSEDDWHGPYLSIVDSGADFSIAPMALLNSIDAPIDHSSAIRSPWGERQAVDVYEIDVRIANAVLPRIWVAGDPTTDQILLGRNLLNYLDIELDGPKLELRLLNI